MRQTLKSKAHHLKPVILIGAKGLTPAVVDETNIAIEIHELIKVRIYGAEREDRQLMANDLCEQLKAQLVQLIGNTAIIYRKKPDAKISNVDSPAPKASKRRVNASSARTFPRGKSK